ncbi:MULTISPECIES: tRNA dihydrouridine(20/20a) synthase DusA [Legionella]|nr:tRNA dihydrouridine(20/20a) synthase DusA [Legionella septentrionalis]
MHSSSLPALLSKLAIAPMIDWSYTHFRVLMRLLAPQALVYTEMQTPGAIFNNPARALRFSPIEKPIALQLGGSDKNSLVKCAQIAEEQGFDEVNLNLGCPSDRVQAGRFGACLMNEPEQVAECLAAMKKAVHIPVTAKTRIGIDHQDSYEFFATFARRLVQAGCDKLIVHARKAWLHGLNPKQNRTIPPLHYDYVYRIKQELPDIPIVINGHINDIAAVHAHLNQVDGVMIGRLACQHPYAISSIHQTLFPQVVVPSRVVIFEKYMDYLYEAFAKEAPLSMLIKPALNLAHGLPGAKFWKEMMINIQRTKDLQQFAKALDLLNRMELAVAI